MYETVISAVAAERRRDLREAARRDRLGALARGGSRGRRLGR